VTEREAAQHLEERRWIDRELAGKLSPKVRARLHDHLRSCEACRRYHDRGVAAFGAIGPNAARAISPFEREQVEGWLFDGGPRAIAGVEEGQRSRWTRAWIGVWLGIGAAGAALAVVTWARGRGGSTEPETTILSTAAPEGEAARSTAPRRERRPSAEWTLPQGAHEPAFVVPDGPPAPPTLSAGRLGPAPPGGKSRHALQAVRYHGEQAPAVGVRFEDRSRGLFAFDRRLWIAFDYWLGQSLRPEAYLEVAFRLAGDTRDYVFRARGPERGRWARLAIPLDEARPYADRTLRPPEAGRVDLLKVRTNWNDESELFLSDVRVVRVAPADSSP
jgi:hypothetical protein